MSFKSLNFNLLVVSLSNEDAADLTEQLQVKKKMAPAFFQDAPIVVKIDTPDLMVDFNLVKQTVSAEGFILVGISGELSSEQKAQLSVADIAYLRTTQRAEKSLNNEDKTSNSSQNEPVVTPLFKTKVHNGRIRSGQQLYAKDSHLVIDGDVAAGAEVIADGNVHVYGALRGKAVAGASGNKEAMVICKSLRAELISIAGIYKLSEALPVLENGEGCITALENEEMVFSSLKNI